MIGFWISAALMLITAAIHSKAGETRLIGPLLASNVGVMANRQSRSVLRAAWHLTSVFMATNALVMAWPAIDEALKAVIAGLWLVVGLSSLISSRGRHVGWPWLTGAGLSGLIGSL